MPTFFYSIFVDYRCRKSLMFCIFALYIYVVKIISLCYKKFYFSIRCQPSAVPDPFSSDPFAPVSSATANPVLTASTASTDKTADLFAGENNGNTWSDPFGSSHSDPFSGGANETMSDMNDPWSAFSESATQVMFVC